MDEQAFSEPNILDVTGLERVSPSLLEHPDPSLAKDVEELGIQIYDLVGTSYFIMCQYDNDSKLQFDWYLKFEDLFLPINYTTLEEILDSDIEPEKLEGLLYNLDLLS